MPRRMKHFLECFKVRGPEECWLWEQGLTGTGYGHKKINGVFIKAHILVYKHYKGEYPAGLVLDHLCGVKHCVNPYHLEPVSPKINTYRGISRTAIRRKNREARVEREKYAKIL